MGPVPKPMKPRYSAPLLALPERMVKLEPKLVVGWLLST